MKSKNPALIYQMPWVVRFGVAGLGLFVGAVPTTLGKSSPNPDQTNQNRRRDTRLEQRLERSQDRLGIPTTNAPLLGIQPSGTLSDQGGLTAGVQPEASGVATPEEIVAAIRLRAEQELARRRARKWDLNTLAVWTVADETNPNLNKAHKSAFSTEEYLSSTFSYRFIPQLTWQAGYNLDALNYNEFTDLSTLTNSLTTKLIWWLTNPLRIEAHYTFDDNEYPYDRGSSTWDQTVHLRVRHSFLRHYYHYAGWSYLNRQYKDQPNLDGNDNQILGKYRKDQRHTGIYEIGGTFREHTMLGIRQEFSFHKSNAAFQDFYDAQDYRVRLSGSHNWSERWSSSGSFTYELKRYEQRDVSDRAVAERDDVKTYQIGLTYRLGPEVDLTYTWRYVRQYSNDATQKFGDVTNSFALTAAF